MHIDKPDDLQNNIANIYSKVFFLKRTPDKLLNYINSGHNH